MELSGESFLVFVIFILLITPLFSQDVDSLLIWPNSRIQSDSTFDFDGKLWFHSTVNFGPARRFRSVADFSVTHFDSVADFRAAIFDGVASFERARFFTAQPILGLPISTA